MVVRGALLSSCVLLLVWGCLSFGPLRRFPQGATHGRWYAEVETWQFYCLYFGARPHAGPAGSGFDFELGVLSGHVEWTNGLIMAARGYWFGLAGLCALPVLVSRLVGGRRGYRRAHSGVPTLHEGVSTR